MTWDDPDGPAGFDRTAPGRAWRALADRQAREGQAHHESQAHRKSQDREGQAHHEGQERESQPGQDQSREVPGGDGRGGTAGAEPSGEAGAGAGRAAPAARGVSDREAEQSARVDLLPLASRGLWSGRQPFGDPRGRPAAGGAVLALTRARLRPTRAVAFWRAVPPVAEDLRRASGLLARFGVGEAPIGWQGTISVWRSATDLVRFAYRQPEHRAVIERTARAGWYAEELFARFAVLGVHGEPGVLGWSADGREGQRG
nr:monooxygenase [Micromonospora sp. NBRC 107566]